MAARAAASGDQQKLKNSMDAARRRAAAEMAKCTDHVQTDQRCKQFSFPLWPSHDDHSKKKFFFEGNGQFSWKHVSNQSRWKIQITSQVCDNKVTQYCDFFSEPLFGWTHGIVKRLLFVLFNDHDLNFVNAISLKVPLSITTISMVALTVLL